MRDERPKTSAPVPMETSSLPAALVVVVGAGFAITVETMKKVLLASCCTVLV